MMNAFQLALQFGAARRLTRLVTKDEIARPLRENHLITGHEKLSYLVNCPICVGVYTSAGIMLSSIVFPKASKYLIAALALAELQASTTEYEARRDSEDTTDFGTGF